MACDPEESCIESWTFPSVTTTATLGSMPNQAAMVPAAPIERSILLIRGQKVMLDADLAALYRVPTKVLIQSVKRNATRFPDDFMFRLTAGETSRLRSQFVTSNAGRGGRRYAPYAFTEHGVAMLSSVLRSPRAIHVNIAIVRTFVRLRRLLGSNEMLARRLDDLERRYDGQFKIVFDAIRKLMTPSAAPRRAMGFRPPDDTPSGRTSTAHSITRGGTPRPRRTFPSRARPAAG
jgi:hypothetical protein